MKKYLITVCLFISVNNKLCSQTLYGQWNTDFIGCFSFCLNKPQNFMISNNNSNCSATLNWTVSCQRSFSYFSVQRTCNPLSTGFVEIAQVIGNPGTSFGQSLSYVDFPPSNVCPSSSNVFYRIVIVYEGAEREISEIKLWSNKTCINNTIWTPCNTTPTMSDQTISFCNLTQNICTVPIKGINNLLRQEISWNSSNTNIVQVNSSTGELKPINYGTATITAVLGFCGQTVSTNVTVNECPTPCSSTIYFNSKTIQSGIPSGDTKASSIFVGQFPTTSILTPNVAGNLVTNNPALTTRLYADNIRVKENFRAYATGSGMFLMKAQQCSQTFSRMSSNKSKTSLSILDKEEKIRIFPNPASNNISINYSSLANGKVAIRLLNAHGVFILQKLINSNNGKIIQQTNLDITSLKNGIYIIQITDEHGNNYSKLFNKIN